MSLSASSSHRKVDKGGQPLNLAAMIDIFTVLLIFLILTFVADEKAFEVATDATLPTATAELKGIAKVQVQVSAEGFYLVDGERFTDLTAVIASLQAKAAFHESILLVADQNLSFDKIDRTVAALTKAGFTEFQFLTAQKEELP